LFTIYGININVNAIFILFTIIVASILLIKNKRFIIRKLVVTKYFLLFLIVAISGSIISETSIKLSFEIILRWVGIFCFFIFGYYYNMSQKYEKLTYIPNIILLSSIIPIIIAFWQIYTGTYNYYTSDLGRVQGTFEHPGILGTYCVICLAYSLPLYLYNKRKNYVLMIIICLSIVLILTFFKTAWIGLLLIVLILFSKFKTYRSTYIIIAILLGIIYLFYNDILSRLYDVNSLDWRTGVWNILLNNKSLNILGGGFGTTMNILKSMPYSTVTTAHNTYLELFLDVGLIGLTIFLILHIIMYKYSRYIYKSKEYIYRQMGFSGIMLTASFSVMYFAQTMLNPIIQIYFWLLIGVNTGIKYNIDNVKLISH